MENVYTEILLKKLKKEGLLKIAADNEIEIPDGATNPQIIALIVEKGCPIPGDEDDSPKFGKEYFLTLNWYSHRRGALAAVLDDDKEYSIAAVERLLAGK